MKTILVASDLSARSDRALARAAMLAGQHNARLIILHVVDEELPAAMADNQIEDATRMLGSAVAGLPELSAISSKVQVVVGEHYRTILAEAEASNADLLVVGQHRKDILLDLFRGSTGERILRFGTRPVLIVKSAATHRYVSVLAAIDFSATSRRAIETAVMIAPEADVKLVHAFDIPFRGLVFGGTSMEQLAKKHQRQFQETIEAQTKTFLDSLPVPSAMRQVIAREGMPEEVVLEAVRETRCDLLALGTHGRSGLGRALLGSVAESMIARAPCDVLAVRSW
jgi:nucleotide-binding universal stress UspA family protein